MGSSFIMCNAKWAMGRSFLIGNEGSVVRNFIMGSDARDNA